MAEIPKTVFFDPSVIKDSKLEKQVKVLEPLAIITKLKPGEPLAESGSKPSCCYYIKSGIVLGKYPVNDSKKKGLGLTELYGSGSMLFYEYSMVDQPVEAAYSALTNVTLMSLSFVELNKAAAALPELQKLLLSLLSSNVLHANLFTGKQNPQSPWNSYCKLLLLMAKECGTQTDKGTVISTAYNQTDMANILNISRTALHFICQKLQEDNIIHQKRMEIIIPSMDALKNCCEKNGF